jgi:phage-related protein
MVLPPFTVNVAASYVFDIDIDQKNLYFGGSYEGTLQYQGLTTCTNNGSTASYPVIKIKRSGGTSATIASLINYTDEKTVWLDYDMSDGETVTIDFRPGRRAVTSDRYGDIWNAVKRNSDFNYFRLLPGANIIGAYVELAGAPTMTATISWDLVHWSADGVAA